MGKERDRRESAIPEMAYNETKDVPKASLEPVSLEAPGTPVPQEPAKGAVEPMAETLANAAPVVPFVVFAQLSGVKPDQLAGFRHHVSVHKLGPRSIADWRDELARFNARLVK